MQSWSSRIGRLVAAAAGTLLAATVAGAPANAASEGPLPPPGPSCSTTSTGDGSKEVDLTDSTGELRKYRLFVPAGITGPAPLIIALHGGQSNPATFEGQSGWTGFAKTNKVIVAYPRGSKPDGGAGKWAWEFARNTGPDVAYLRSVAEHIAGTYCVAPNRVHFVGHSNGGQMTTRMACEGADWIASAAVWAGAKGAWDAADCPASRPISYAVMVNDNDPIIWQWLAEQHRDHWREMNDCGAEHSESGPGVLRGQRFDCAAGTEVVYRLYDGPDDLTKAHNWPADPAGAHIRSRMWELFDGNRLP
ncbi:Poly(3-hydroxybutyrate) depolymerase [Nocardia cyriacigeorgica]|uniref:Poly(3-hydroxybutyrate) depolymerase n=1 Tax=Nocardia cyriacigeorgica TaxID=135487 RepID=A0A4U8VU94_9NOCA|nr:Poly(3-hydroxybutyrate) depolymerase [Nocardia cyriacigeorgica]